MWGYVGLEDRTASFDSGLDCVHVTYLVSGGHQLLLELLLPVFHVPVCIGHVDLLMLLGLLELLPLHRGHIHLRLRDHYLVTGVRVEDLLVFFGLKGRLWLHDSTSKVGIGGHSDVGVFWRVVRVGSELLSLYSQIDTV